MSSFADFVSQAGSFVWGPFLLIPLLLGTGLFLTIRLGGLQFRKLGPALRLALVQRSEKPRDGSGDTARGDISHYQALTTALAATVGVGNIAGVATAIGLGGPGALFWMWVTGLVGMASKYSEAFLGSRFRVTDEKGEQRGGPQEYLKQGIRGPLGKVLAVAFALFAALAAFGIGNMTQTNTIAHSLDDTFGVPPLVTGIVITVLVGVVLVGGIKRIGAVTASFVPAMILFYLLAGLLVLATNVTAIPDALALVFTDAFTGTAATGGFVGSTVALALQFGVARGLFSNESGLGSAAIVAAAAKSHHPVRQGLVSMTQTFIDTIVVVTFTGLVIITSGAWYSGSAGAAMTAEAMSSGPLAQVGGAVVAIAVVFFALSTVIGWAYYGERCATSLFGIRVSLPYRAVFTLVCLVGALWELDLVWGVADILNGLMALPNLVGLLLLSGLVARETRAYLKADPDLTQPPSSLGDYTPSR
ncbi:sodium:alanine symporter family protein [Xylanimonas oleitrophica]|uniref:Sodium:alanine symporter family protein n=1 Tax=Xylanimonas oleitrophica TaxID=2607479 RepID=A0A2W5X2E7_9MICO|nr:amino acid carrier protein [Xylanimonas oleitrophica]PZR55016.1 sodium:alanine symporter family protein [Xylanimonas oleitrophica]